MKTNISARTLTEMKKSQANPADPVLENAMERLFEGSQAADLQGLVERYARFKMDREGEWIDGETFMAEFQMALEYAFERAQEDVDQANADEREGA